MPMHDMHSRRMQAQQLMIVWCMRSRRVVYNIYHIDLNEPQVRIAGFKLRKSQWSAIGL